MEEIRIFIPQGNFKNTYHLLKALTQMNVDFWVKERTSLLERKIWAILSEVQDKTRKLTPTCD